jgi:hypothetical protein
LCSDGIFDYFPGHHPRLPKPQVPQPLIFAKIEIRFNQNGTIVNGRCKPGCKEEHGKNVECSWYYLRG